MVDFLKVKVNRLSDSVVLQHLWNSIDDLVLCGVLPSKTNVIERCKTTYDVETNEINKNLFLALKEGTISRSVKTDILSRIKAKEDKTNGDWYCFLCHKVGPDTFCQRCDTSFHSTCNSDLSDQFHCHTCICNARFSTYFQKFTSTTKLRIIHRVIYVNKIKWQSLNIVGYIEDDLRNNFFIYKIVNAIEIDKRVSLGKYFVSDENSENLLFDLLLLRHNCAVIYGSEHEFSRIITGYIKHLNTELDNIYCESCFLLFSQLSNQKLCSTKKQELFCSVCTVQHPIMWGFVPPNVFWPFKLISQDNNRYYGIMFSKPIQINRQKLESFSKDLSLVWSSYNLQNCDRPSLELLKAYSMAKLYAQNLFEAQKLSNSSTVNSRNRVKKSSNKQKSQVRKVLLPLSEETEIPRKKIGRPPKSKLSSNPKSIRNCQSEVKIDRKVPKTISHCKLKSNIVYTSKKKAYCPTKASVTYKVKDKPTSDTKPKANHSLQVKIRRPKNKTTKSVYQRTFVDNISSTDSSSENLINVKDIIYNTHKRKRIKDVFISDDEKPAKISKLITTKSGIKRKERCNKNVAFSTDYESNSDSVKFEEFNTDRSNISSRKYRHRKHQSTHLFRPSSHQSLHQSRDTNEHISQYQTKHVIRNKSFENYSSDDTIPQRAANLNSLSMSDESDIPEELSYQDIKYKELSKHHRRHGITSISKTYNVYPTTSSYIDATNRFINDRSKNLYLENNHDILSLNRKNPGHSQCHSGSLESGRYCSSGSPVNFSPISNHHQNVANTLSTSPSNYPMNHDESSYQSSGNLNMKIILRNRAFRVYSPLQLGINVDSKIVNQSPVNVHSITTNQCVNSKDT